MTTGQEDLFVTLSTIFVLIATLVILRGLLGYFTPQDRRWKNKSRERLNKKKRAGAKSSRPGRGGANLFRPVREDSPATNGHKDQGLLENLRQDVRTGKSKAAGMFRRDRELDRQFADKMRQNQTSVLESFDYNGVKILNDNGTYTFDDNGRVSVFSSYEELPYHYQKMLAEIDNARREKGKVVLETINGRHTVIFPDGKKKKYKRLEDIPPRVRALLDR